MIREQTEIATIIHLTGEETPIPKGCHFFDPRCTYAVSDSGHTQSRMSATAAAVVFAILR